MTVDELTTAVSRYAARFHAAVGDGHHVASPLGAWLLLALCGSAAAGVAGAELAEVLGVDLEEAATAARALLDMPHGLVAAAAAVWNRPEVVTEAWSAWLAGLASAVTTGGVPTQQAVDAWASEHSLGMIPQFPLALAPDTLVVLATALATRISWSTPFETAPADALGAGSPWRERLTRVLRSPRRGHHHQFIAVTDDAGDLAVHTAWAGRTSGRTGEPMQRLEVTSVIADADVPPRLVLSAAHDIAVRRARNAEIRRRSLFDLPLGESSLWTISEADGETTAPDGREEHVTAVLPAWSAQDGHKLLHPELGFPAAAAALSSLAGTGGLPFEAAQSVVARYTRVGFEAAAVTGIMLASARPRVRPGVVRTAELRFGHPYAVVAVATDDRYDELERRSFPGPWHGVPVFSAWVAEPDDAQDELRASAR